MGKPLVVEVSLATDIVIWLSVFFFVKQKTAYEMRISDWSSDVCSSDLLAGLAPVHHGLATALGLEATLAWSVEAEDGAFVVAARACGLASAAALPAWYGDLMTRCGVERRLDRKSTRLNSSHYCASRMPSSP